MQPLVTRLRKGEPEAFDELVREYFAPLARFAYTYIKSVDVAEDVAQDVLVWTWENRNKIDPKGSLAAYLHAAARNRTLDYIRRHQTEERFRLSSVDADDLQSRDPLSLLSEYHDVAAIRAAISKLAERQQTALRLRYRREMSHAEVAQVLGVSPKAAKELIYRAIESLRSALGLPPN